MQSHLKKMTFLKHAEPLRFGVILSVVAGKETINNFIFEISVYKKKNGIYN